jgi:hypothetical protein
MFKPNARVRINEKAKTGYGAGRAGEEGFFIRRNPHKNICLVFFPKWCMKYKFQGHCGTRLPEEDIRIPYKALYKDKEHVYGFYWVSTDGLTLIDGEKKKLEDYI